MSNTNTPDLLHVIYDYYDKPELFSGGPRIDVTPILERLCTWPGVSNVRVVRVVVEEPKP